MKILEVPYQQISIDTYDGIAKKFLERIPDISRDDILLL
jgi:hypothetical protein